MVANARAPERSPESAVSLADEFVAMLLRTGAADGAPIGDVCEPVEHAGLLDRGERSRAAHV
jgi:hypothetical protein